MKALFLPGVSIVLATTLWYLLGAAEVTRWLWTRYPPWFDRWAQCSACSSTWYGAGWAVLFEEVYGWSFFGIEGWPGWILTGLWCMTLCPLLAARMFTALTHGGDPAATEGAGG